MTDSNPVRQDDDIDALAEIWRTCDRASYYSKSKLVAAIAGIVEARTKARALAPPKPAPDAMREALKPFATFGRGEGITVESLARDRIGDWFGPSDFDAAYSVYNFAAPVLSPDAGRIDLLRALMKIAHHAPSQTVRPVTIARDALVQAIGTWQQGAIDDLSPSPAVAAEPVARCPVCDWPMATDQSQGCVPGDCSYRPDDPAEQERIRKRRAELATPPVRRDREAIARLVDPFAFIFENPVSPETQIKRDIAGMRADDILSFLALPVQPGAGERDIILECADIAAKYEDCSADFIADKLREYALSR